ncbi:MAG: fluoride efflux transporter CrcB [Butyricicoccaceae bacterium]
MPGFVFVGLGGALGAVARYFVSLLPARTEFPVWTLLTNLAGALLIGFVVGMVSADPNLPKGVSLFWKTGVCGGFTTFSTFSLEAMELLERGRTALGISYILASVVLCLLGVCAGKALAAAARGSV